MSQNINQGYFNIVNNDRKAYISFLISIKSLPEFDNFYQLAKKMYGNKIDNGVFQDQIKTQKEIDKTLLLLNINPKQKNLLYNLYLLYQHKNNSHLAQEYLNKAKLIDPMIK